MSAVKITMINYKGGVGKTTSVYNLASGLRFLCDKRVLMVDLDPQCSLTNISLKSYSRKQSRQIKIEDIQIIQSVNYIFRQYLRTISLGLTPDVDLDNLILSNFYQGHERNRNYELFDIIPATMFDFEDGNDYPQGLDDLEIKIARHYFGENTMLNHITILAKFFKACDIEDRYDFILFDCPPANSLITQNALVVSDYYLIPSIMDEMSSYGIPHMHNLIQNTIFRQMNESYRSLLDSTESGTYLDYIRDAPKLLGIFETLLKTGVDTSSVRSLVRRNHTLFDTVIYNHIDTARTTSDGSSCFSVNIQKNVYSPHICYSKLVAEVLTNMGVPFDNTVLQSKTTRWM